MIMPWTTDNNGDRKYVVSIYAKEELPTWSEVYEEFFKNKQFVYIPQEGEELDPYWKLPRRKLLLAIVCNQLNKMLFEDGMHKKLIQYISENILPNCCDVRFTCEPIEDPFIEVNENTIGTTIAKWQATAESKLVGTNSAPPIYTFPLPTGKTNPFITSSHPRVNINDITGNMCLFPIIKFHKTEAENFIHAPLLDQEDTKDLHYSLIQFMMKQFEEYFLNGVGWKDYNGILLESSPMSRSCEGAGVDPAL